MNNRFRTTLFGFAVLAALVVSAIHPMLARADDSTPVAPASPAAAGTSVSSTDTSAPSTSVAPPDTSVPATSPAATDTSAPASTAAPADTSAPSPSVAPSDTSVPAATDTSTAPTASSVPATPVAPTSTSVSPTDTEAAPSATDTTAALSEVPTGTAVVVVDATGTAVPLATQAAADIIQSGDPIWCPNGAKPIAGQGGCTGSYSDLLSLVSSGLSGVTGANGTIWIEAGTDTSEHSITIYGNTLSNLQTYTLTVQGGWNGNSNGGISGDSEFDGNSIGIINWENDVTVNDLYIHDDGTGFGAGLAVQTTGNITLHHVKADNNEYDGARLDNTASTSGASITIGSDSLGNSEFSGNASDGLEAISNGDISLSGVTADDNTDFGAFLVNVADPPSITITNSHFDANGEDGLDAISNGDISLSGVTADGNTFTGAVLNDIGIDPTITNSQFDGNGYDGLVVLSLGDTTLTGVTADDNDGTGALLKTGGNITVTNSDFSINGSDGLDAGTFAGDITVTNSSFSTNGSDGLAAFTPSGDITISGVTASGNAEDGIFIQQVLDPTDLVTCSVASNNGGYGVDSDLAEGTTLAFDGVTFSGNGSGDYNGLPIIGTSIKCGGGKSSGASGLAYDTVNVTSGTTYAPDCINYIGTNFVLPNGNRVGLPCTSSSGKTSLGDQGGSNLPGPLPNGSTFQSGLNFTTTSSLTGSATVSFPVSQFPKGSKFAILYWDGTKWVNLGGSINQAGFFSVDTNLTGVFVLVTQ